MSPRNGLLLYTHTHTHTHTPTQHGLKRWLRRQPTVSELFKTPNLDEVMEDPLEVGGVVISHDNHVVVSDLDKAKHKYYSVYTCWCGRAV